VNYSNLAFYKSPDIDFKPSFSSEFYFKEIEWYRTIDDATNYNFITFKGFFVFFTSLFDGYSPVQGKMYWQKNTNTINDNYSRGIYYAYRNGILPGILPQQSIKPVLKSQLIGIDSQVPSSFSVEMQGLDYSHIVKSERTNPTLGSDTDPSLSGIGSKGLFCEMMDGWGFNPNHNEPSYFTTFPSGVVMQAPYKKLVAQCRFNFAQYGGPWRSNRYFNTYIAKSKLYNNPGTSTFSTESIQGDVY